ncbi:hypothetical protein, partial [Faecalibacterium prausnitzii]|uniref:hypothetical protein n=1 Tax=Faecalibacterium prausnitzii TaxID=853 RepID=UPI002911982B
AILIHAGFTPIHAGSEKIIADFYGTSTKASSLFAAKKRRTPKQLAPGCASLIFEECSTQAFH